MKPTDPAVVAHINNQIRMDNLIKGIVELSPVLQADILADNSEVMALHEHVEELEAQLDEANESKRDLRNEVDDLKNQLRKAKVA